MTADNKCLVTNHSAEYFVRLTDETEAAVPGALAGRTLADSLDESRHRPGRRRSRVGNP